MFYNKNLYKLILLFTVIAGVGFLGLRESSAQVNLRCYQRAVLQREIDCTQCDEIDPADYQSFVTQCEDVKGMRFDVSTCTCVPPSNDCSGWDNEAIKKAANACYAGGKFWNDNYCVCLTDVPGEVVDVDQDVRDITQIIFFKTNFDGSVDNISELIRMAFILFFALIAVVALFLGIYGMYLYSTAREDEEKVKLAQKLFKNGLLGLGIAVLGVAVVQLVALFLGVDTQDLFVFKISD